MGLVVAAVVHERKASEIMESFQHIARSVNEKRQRNGYSKDEAIAIIRKSSQSFLAAASRFGYSSEHVNQVIAAHTADIDKIESGKPLSIVKYTHQGAYIYDEV